MTAARAVVEANDHVVTFGALQVRRRLLADVGSCSTADAGRKRERKPDG